MSEDKKSKMWINRIVSLIIAGGLMFLVMNFYVANKIRKELDECKYEATGLLNDAKASFENNDYDKAKETLNTLFIKHPDSNETAEGKKMYTEVQDGIKKEQNKQKEMDKKWEAAVGAIQEKWQKEKATQLREQLEKEMNDTLDKEWEKVKENIREEWERQ